MVSNSAFAGMRMVGAAEIRDRLTYDVCVPAVRGAMVAFSAGDTRQVLRSIIPLSDGRVFGVMPGALGERSLFGAKLISVAARRGRSSHQGLLVLFDPESGSPCCLADAGEITRIRTASTSAMATQALARDDASRLLILGTGEQAEAHVQAIASLRPLTATTIWGRSPDSAEKLAHRLSVEHGIFATATHDLETAAGQADIICTVTSASEPILFGRWVRPGTHVNIVGSSYAGPAEVDVDLVSMARFIVDSREGVLAQGAEFLAAKAAGRIDGSHIVGEIGEVLAGKIEGRQSGEQVTVYKSLGHIVQDLAAIRVLLND